MFHPRLRMLHVSFLIEDETFIIFLLLGSTYICNTVLNGSVRFINVKPNLLL